MRKERTDLADDDGQLVYAGAIEGANLSRDYDQPFVPGLVDGDLDVRLTRDSQGVQIRDSRSPHIVCQINPSAGTFGLFDPDRKVLTYTDVGLRQSPQDWTPFRRKGATKFVLGDRDVDAVEFTAPLGRVRINVVMSAGDLVDEALAAAARLWWIPTDARLVGLPLAINVIDARGGKLTARLQAIEKSAPTAELSHDWERVPFEDLIGIELTPPAPGRSSDDLTSSPSLAADTAERSAMSPRSHKALGPDAAWIVRHGHLDAVRGAVNAILRGFTGFSGDLAGTTVDWWGQAKKSIDHRQSALGTLQRLALFAALSGAFADQDNVWSNLFDRNPIRAHMSEAEFDQFETNIDILSEEIRNNFPIIDVLPEFLRLLQTFIQNDDFNFPAELAETFDVQRWIAFYAAIASSIPESADDREAAAWARLGELAYSYWTGLIETFGEEDMPGAPVDVTVPAEDRTYNEIVYGSDVQQGGSVNGLAEVSITAHSIAATLPETKLSKLEIEKFKLDSQNNEFPVIAGAVTLDEIQVDFEFESKSAKSAVVFRYPILAIALTARGAGRLSLENVRFHFTLEPELKSGHAVYEFKLREPEIGRLSSELPHIDAAVTVAAVTAAWTKGNADALLDRLQSKLLDGLRDRFEGLQNQSNFQNPSRLPFPWPTWPDALSLRLENDGAGTDNTRVLRLDESPSEENRAGPTADLVPEHDSFVRGYKISGSIEVPRAPSDRDPEEEGNGENSAGDGKQTYFPSPAPFGLDPDHVSSADAGFAFSLRFLESWLLDHDQVGLPSDFWPVDVDPLLDELGIELPPLQGLIRATDLGPDETPGAEIDPEDVADRGDAASDPGGHRVGTNCGAPPSGPRRDRRRIKRVTRTAPTFSLPPAGSHQHALEIQLGYRFTIKDEQLEQRWVPEVTLERCFPNPRGDRLGETVENTLREVIRDEIGRLDRGVRPPGRDGRSGETDPRGDDVRESRTENLRERFAEDEEGTTQPPTRVRSLRVSGPGRSDRNAGDVVCLPPECDWRSDVNVKDEETYLSAYVTVRAQVRVGFSTFLPFTAHAVGERSNASISFALGLARDRLERLSWSDTAGWLPELQLELVNEYPDALDGKVSEDVAIHAKAPPFDNLDSDKLKQELLEFCKEDMFSWLSPLANRTPTYDFQVSHQGGLISDALATYLIGILGKDPIAENDRTEVHHLSRLARLVGENAPQGYHQPLKHIVRGDYVYLPVHTEQNLEWIFKT